MDEKTAKDLKAKIGNQAFDVTQNKGTEAPFSGEYVDLQDDGLYHCKVCNNALFSSKTKANSRTGPIGLQGWPHFRNAIEGAVKTQLDTSHGMERVEVVCAQCGSHLGHVFEDYKGDGKHYCINSVSLDFKKGDNS
ncbi:MAG: peptide-methionine (R)-S-oxide reductase MsrB [Candidatus Paceibacterota bacterium]